MLLDLKVAPAHTCSHRFGTKSGLVSSYGRLYEDCGNRDLSPRAAGGFGWARGSTKFLSKIAKWVYPSTDFFFMLSCFSRIF